VPPAFIEREWRSRDGLTLYSRDYPAVGGEKSLPVVCLHGLTRNSKDFEEVAPRLAGGGRRVIVPDVRGRGRSAFDPKPKRYQPFVYARDVLELLDSLGIGRAVFIGTSMGGLITLMVAGLRLRAIAAAVLNDVGPEVDQAGIDRILSYAGKLRRVESWADAVDYVRQTGGAAFPNNSEADWESFARCTFREESGRPVFDYDPAIMVPMSKGPPKTRSFIGMILFRRLARSRPTLLIRGELSDLLSERIAARMKRNAPALELAVIPGVGHAPLLTEPAAVEAIDEFLSRMP
jgi:pimeloyl-ACP methyl ester carboxylesterase